MKAQVLTICVPYKGCDKNCPYCVSRMTGYCHSNLDLMTRNIPKVQEIARAAQIGSVLFTGKGEPLLNLNPLLDLMWKFKDFPMELQTNGIVLNQNPELLRALQAQGLDVLAVSIDHWAQVHEYRKMFEEAKRISLTVRITANLVKEVMEHCFSEWVEHSRTVSDQLSFRSITIPNGAKHSETENWILQHINRETELSWLRDMETELKFRGHDIRKLPYGSIVTDYKGMAVTHFTYCIQDNHGENDIRSLIFQEDGHLYTTWNSNASRLF